MTFERFVAIDWSGARGPAYDGIAVVQCYAGEAAPRIVPPPGTGRWRRSDVLAWMLAEIQSGAATLFGFDFAFSLPFCDRNAYLPGSAYPPQTPAELWRCVDDLCIQGHDFYAGELASLSELRGFFWRGGKRPAGFDERLRVTDQVCRDAGLGRPQSVFKLIGAAQVGKGSLAGMRFLFALRRAVGDGVSIWPFDGVATGVHVCCEIYLGLFAARGGGRGKIRDDVMLSSILARLGCGDGLARAVARNDHEANALVSAAGLRYYAGRESSWRPAHMTPEAGHCERWIFGLT